MVKKLVAWIIRATIFDVDAQGKFLDEWQGDSAVFKRYSQAKLKMMREALAKLDRGANEHADTFATV
jgi:hypothetical protein